VRRPAQALPFRHARDELTVLFLPPGFEGGSEVAADADGVKYYREIKRPLPGGLRVPFVLIPRMAKRECLCGTPDPVPTFYMMRYKVWVGLFRRFAPGTPGAARGDDRHPVLGVKVEEAHAFAARMKGKLPSTAQWDKAAGLCLAGRGEGPYRGRWKEGPRPDIAVNCSGGGPRLIGEARDAVSPIGCRDMAVNGNEWTGTI